MLGAPNRFWPRSALVGKFCCVVHSTDHCPDQLCLRFVCVVTQFARNSNTTVYSSHCIIEQLYLDYPGVTFVESVSPHTLLVTNMLLFIPGSAHLYIDKPVDDLLWTNPQVIWKHPYSDQYNLLELRRPITALEKGQDRFQQTTDRVGDIEKAFCTSYSCFKNQN